MISRGLWCATRDLNPFLLIFRLYNKFDFPYISTVSAYLDYVPLYGISKKSHIFPTYFLTLISLIRFDVGTD